MFVQIHSWCCRLLSFWSRPPQLCSLASEKELWKINKKQKHDEFLTPPGSINVSLAFHCQEKCQRLWQGSLEQGLLNPESNALTRRPLCSLMWVTSNPSQLMRYLLTIARNFAFMLTLCTLISECIISILFFIQFPKYRQGEFVYRSKAFFVGDHFLYSHDLNVWFRGNNVGRN